MVDKEWTEVRYRKIRNGVEDHKSITSFYVSNLPSGVSNSLLWKAFQPFGNVVDAYVAKKKDSRGNFFGFVRYARVIDLKGLLAGMNSVKIFEAKVSASLAKYDKNHQKIEHHLGGNRFPPTFIKPTNQSHMEPRLNRVNLGYSYKDAAVNKPMNHSPASKSIVLDDNMPLYPKHCFGRSVLGEAKTIRTLCNMRMMLNSGGLGGVGISYIGGLKVLLTFKDQSQANDFLVGKKKIWENVLSSAEIWSGQDIQFDRIAGLKVIGIPFQHRDNSVYDKIGECFGKVVWPSEFSWESEDNSSGFCYVLTKTGNRIEEEVKITWKNRSYQAWVTEEMSSWIPTFFKEGSNQNSNMEDEVEEGEFRQQPPANQETNSQESGTFRIPLGNEKSSFIGLQNMEKRVHGTASSMSMGNANRPSNYGSTMFNGSLPNVSSGSVFSIGLNPAAAQSNGNRSKKRPRRHWSPQSASPTMRINDPEQCIPTPSVSSFPDLNKPIQQSSITTSTTMENLECQSEQMLTTNRPVTPLEQLHPDPESVDQGAEVEVVNTMDVGVRLGINLEGFNEKLRSLIHGEVLNDGDAWQKKVEVLGLSAGEWG
ncbi:hypothetical protein E3N88_23546 [Mikania micrantha]|uniref:RRM domain-containing protein n=1 Tax=Mikania micrantha TaxID=192012 RepID=A0A5N6NG44_9ASTR|nr:hypothetical protein E3N88_23546 [Mikania micrantha]